MEITCEIFGKPHPLPHATEGSSPAREAQGPGAGARHELSTGIYGSFTQKSHVISLGQFSISLTNVGIATTVFQNLKG